MLQSAPCPVRTFVRRGQFGGAILCALLAVSACQSNVGVSRAEPEPLRIRMEGPPNAQPGTCWGRDTTPAVVETVTEQILLQPAEIGNDGAVREPAIYKTETRQNIVKQRNDIWFETPCASDLTPTYIASVQRALKARGYYRPAITGEMDARTRRAIRNYQAPQGLNSGILSLAAARQLGISEYGRDELPQR